MPSQMAIGKMALNVIPVFRPLVVYHSVSIIDRYSSIIFKSRDARLFVLYNKCGTRGDIRVCLKYIAYIILIVVNVANLTVNCSFYIFYLQSIVYCIDIVYHIKCIL